MRILAPLALLGALFGAAGGQDLTDATITTSVVLDAIAVENNRPTTQTTFYPGTDRFSVREASLEIEGQYGAQIDYILKGGTATCLGNTQFQLLEASVMVRVAPGLRFGYEKSHVLRGFINHEECVDQLAAEKPNFAGVLSPCHPTGFKAKWKGDLATGWGCDAELALLNGSGGSLDHEHDYNLGLHLSTPLEGLTLTGYANDVEFLTGEWSLEGEALSADGFRWGVGARWEQGPLHLQGETIVAEGFPMQIIGPAPTDATDEQRDDHYSDHRMRCTYAQCGLTVATGWNRAPSVQPYARYQHWNQDTEADGDQTNAYLTLGARLALADESASIRVDFERPIETADTLTREAERLIVRFQIAH